MAVAAADIKLDAVVDFMREPLMGLATLLKELAESNLAGLTAYGAVLDRSFDATRQTAATVLVLQRMDLTLLRRFAQHGASLGAKHIAAPIVMTPDYIAGSLDTFPLEMLEIQQRHVTLAGKDYFERFELQPEHVRLQCERELKRVLIQLRSAVLSDAGRDALLAEAQQAAAKDVVRIVRGLLWMKGDRSSATPDAVVKGCETLCGQSLAGLRGALDAFGPHAFREFAALYQDVERITQFADGGK